MSITVIVPVYNAEEYLDHCIKSVINQSCSNWKLILINDGSTDSSLEICQKFAAQDSRIIVYSQTNKGQAAARNFGLTKVSTLYVTFLDADDEISSDTLTGNMKILSDTAIDCLQYPIYWNYGTPMQYLSAQNRELINDNFYKEWLENKKITWIVCDKVFKMSIFKKVLFEEGIVYEDNLFVAKMLDVINSIYLSEKGVYYYYKRPSSTTTSKLSLKKEQDSFYVTIAIAKILMKKDEKRLLFNFIIRAINISKSLRVNYKKYVEIPAYLFKAVDFKSFVLIGLSPKDKIKFVLAKMNILK